MGVGPLCRLFGKSRQAYYDHLRHCSRQEEQEEIVIEMVHQVRRELPGLGGHKLYKCLYTPFRSHGIKVGRDKLYTILGKHKLLIDRKRRSPRTTQSNHWFRRYPNLIKDMEIVRSNQLWVSDITYICIGYDFNYLSLITDAYSRKIMGYCLHSYLNAQGSVNALKMALRERSSDAPLIHHSDRGVQYCSFDYTSLLKRHDISISMTENGEAYENPIAERINGILKTEFKLNRVFQSRSQAMLEVAKSIESYNHLRPHMSCNYLTPVVAHTTEEPLIKKWKNCRKKYNKTKEKQLTL
jgi:transposase InsO family protein